MQDPKNCKHKSFSTVVKINRLEDTGKFSADIQISCADCDTPFHFPGVRGGSSPREPRCDPFAVELRAPIVPGPLPFPLAESTFEVDLPGDDEPISEAEQ